MTGTVLRHVALAKDVPKLRSIGLPAGSFWLSAEESERQSREIAAETGEATAVVAVDLGMLDEGLLLPAPTDGAEADREEQPGWSGGTWRESFRLTGSVFYLGGIAPADLRIVSPDGSMEPFLEEATPPHPPD